MVLKPVGKTGNGGGAAPDYILIRDEQPNGALSGTFTSGAWRTRVLNTIVHDDGGHASLVSNQVTLAAGKYRFRAHGAAFSVQAHRVRLYNISDSVSVRDGSTQFASSANAVQNNATVEGEFTIASAKIFELQHRCASSFASFGFGGSSSMGIDEVFAVIEFWKVA